MFTTSELIPWPLTNDPYETMSEFKKLGHSDDFKRSVVQHVSKILRYSHDYSRILTHAEQNIRVLSKYYSRIKSTRLAELLGLSEEVSKLTLLAPHIEISLCTRCPL
eukprot:1358123-Amorphochlora_amoeboformis.AAC.4